MLTNPRILGDRARHGASAWKLLEAWPAVPEVTPIGDPVGADELLRSRSASPAIRGRALTDACRGAVAVDGGCRFVAFDGEFRRYPGLAFSHLRPQRPRQEQAALRGKFSAPPAARGVRNWRARACS